MHNALCSDRRTLWFRVGPSRTPLTGGDTGHSPTRDSTGGITISITGKSEETTVQGPRTLFNMGHLDLPHLLKGTVTRRTAYTVESEYGFLECCCTQSGELSLPGRHMCGLRLLSLRPRAADSLLHEVLAVEGAVHAQVVIQVEKREARAAI